MRDPALLSVDKSVEFKYVRRVEFEVVKIKFGHPEMCYLSLVLYGTY